MVSFHRVTHLSAYEYPRHSFFVSTEKAFALACVMFPIITLFCNGIIRRRRWGYQIWSHTCRCRNIAGSNKLQPKDGTYSPTTTITSEEEAPPPFRCFDSCARILLCRLRHCRSREERRCVYAIPFQLSGQVLSKKSMLWENTLGR